MDQLLTDEIVTSHESVFEQSSFLHKIQTRLAQGLPPDIGVFDVDGTVYHKTKDDKGVWEKVGDNNETSRLLTEKSIPFMLESGRPDWNNQTNEEMASLGLTSADIVAPGASSLLYWRNRNGELLLDPEFLELTKKQEIVYFENGQRRTSTYNPALIAEVLQAKLSAFQNQGLRDIKVDKNIGLGFTTLDISGMPFEELQNLLANVKDTFSGIKAEYATNLEAVDPETFTGWVQIVPACAGKDQVLRYVLEKVAKKINPASLPERKPTAHVIGDDTIDIWMLAMGVGPKDRYNLNQYVLGNSTPHASEKFRQVFQALAKPQKEGHGMGRRANIHFLDKQSSEGVLEVVSKLT